MTTADFGGHLPDQLPTIAAAISAQLSLESDVASFLTERAALERDYAAKLQAITRKYKEKKVKRDLECAAGPTPTKEWNGEQTTLSAFVGDMLSTGESSSADHVNLAVQLEKISNDMLASNRKREELRKKHTTYSQKLLSDRDRIYSDREKAKSKYDELCHELESHRQKRERAEAGDKHADRAAKAFRSAEIDMWNGKNTYLIQIQVSNKAKQKFYRQDLPSVENSLQSLWSLTTQRLTSSVAKANTAVASHHELVSSKYRSLDAKAANVDAGKDQLLFVQHNQQRWQEPGEWSFEPCQGFFDKPEMSTESDAVTFLQNRLIRCQNKIAELEPLAEAKQREVSSLEKVRDAYQEQEGLGNPDEVLDNLFEAMRTLLGFQIELHNLYTEVDTIVAVIGEDRGQARPHRFKPASFTIPTSCNFCGGTIWGIAKQGAVCKPCGYTVHQKCEMKVPAECKASPGGGVPSSRGNRSSMMSASGAPERLQRNDSISSTRTPANDLSPASTGVEYGSVNSIPGGSSQTGSVGNPLGSVLYAFEASSPFELTVAEGDVVELIEDDMDNCGWIKVKQGTRQGLVPTSYCDFEQVPGTATPAPSSSSASQGCGKFVMALYDYSAQDPEEHSLVEGEKIELSATGFDYGEGWCEGVKAGKVGIFPSNYVQAL